MVTIIKGTTNKPASSEALVEFFQNHPILNGYLYVGYPIIGTSNGALPIDALWISPEKGLILFVLVEGRNIEAYENTQDEYANKVEAKLRSYTQLMDRRKLCVKISIVTFAPAAQIGRSYDPEYPLCNEKNLNDYFGTINWDNSNYYHELVSVLQSISTIRKGKKKRDVNIPNSRGAILRKLEESIANLDNRQSRAVIETVDGVQRIRGLAGSGKTIVIALKAAYLHAQHPDWKIAITFNARSLKGQLKQLINTFYIEQTNEEPDWSNLQIIHAWGAPGGGDRNGIYYSFCINHDVEYLDYGRAEAKYGRKMAFAKACEKALGEAKEAKQMYDFILIDEAQDFSPYFLRMCYEMLHEPKRLVYAYDELQSLNSQSLPSPEEIFGFKPDGTPKVSFSYHDDGRPLQDIILEKCYRNSRPALVTAHALGFGIYRQIDPEVGTGIVQMFEQTNLWKEIGYEIIEGELSDGKHVKLRRTSKSSPIFLEDHSPVDDLIVFKSFNTQDEQNHWVAKEIAKNLRNEDLRPDDIIVINPNPPTARDRLAAIRAILFKDEIASHTAGVDTSPDIFFLNDDDSIAFTGINRAKGNEAAMVYIVNAQDCFTSYNDIASVRNQLFTAITRSKAWVRVLGVGQNMDMLIEEYNKVKANEFTLDFIYPTKDQRIHINIINRDMSLAEKERVNQRKKSIIELINDLENQKVFVEDLGSEQIKKLRNFLQKTEE